MIVLSVALMAVSTWAATCSTTAPSVSSLDYWITESNAAGNYLEHTLSWTVKCNDGLEVWSYIHDWVTGEKVHTMPDYSCSSNRLAVQTGYFLAGKGLTLGKKYYMRVQAGLGSNESNDYSWRAAADNCNLGIFTYGVDPNPTTPSAPDSCSSVSSTVKALPYYLADSTARNTSFLMDESVVSTVRCTGFSNEVSLFVRNAATDQVAITIASFSCNADSRTVTTRLVLANFPQLVAGTKYYLYLQSGVSPSSATDYTFTAAQSNCNYGVFTISAPDTPTPSNPEYKWKAVEGACQTISSITGCDAFKQYKTVGYDCFNMETNVPTNKKNCSGPAPADSTMVGCEELGRVGCGSGERCNTGFSDRKIYNGVVTQEIRGQCEPETDSLPVQPVNAAVGFKVTIAVVAFLFVIFF